MRKVFYQECIKKKERYREIDKNVIEIWNVDGAKSPCAEKKQINIKYYSLEKAQKNAEKNKTKNRKKCKLDRYPNYGLTINDLERGRGYFKKQNNNPHTQTKEISEIKKEISIEEIKKNKEILKKY